MKLIPRKKPPEPTPLEKAAKFAKLGATGLTAQRVARKSHRNLKFTKRVLTLAFLGAAVAAVAKKMKGTEAPSTPAYTPPPSASTGPSAGTSATAATGTPPVSGNGNAAGGPDVSEALADAGVEGSGPDTPEEAAGEKTVEFLPPVDASGTDDTLDVEAPNQSTPPPPKGK